MGVGEPSARLRAERDGAGNGRVYHVEFSAEDEYGAVCSGEILVAVPKSQRGGGEAVDDGKLYDSTL